VGTWYKCAKTTYKKWIANKNVILTVLRTFIFTQSAGGPMSTTVESFLPNSNHIHPIKLKKGGRRE
jgi:hypothetical protein